MSEPELLPFAAPRTVLDRLWSGARRPPSQPLTLTLEETAGIFRVRLDPPLLPRERASHILAPWLSGFQQVLPLLRRSSVIVVAASGLGPRAAEEPAPPEPRIVQDAFRRAWIRIVDRGVPTLSRLRGRRAARLQGVLGIEGGNDLPMRIFARPVGAPHGEDEPFLADEAQRFSEALGSWTAGATRISIACHVTAGFAAGRYGPRPMKPESGVETETSTPYPVHPDSPPGGRP